MTEETANDMLTHEEATLVLTMIDACLRANGLNTAKIPKAFSILDTALSKLVSMQDPQVTPGERT